MGVDHGVVCGRITWTGDYPTTCLNYIDPLCALMLGPGVPAQTPQVNLWYSYEPSYLVGTKQ